MNNRHLTVSGRDDALDAGLGRGGGCHKLRGRSGYAAAMGF
jgi:hypothetical protein